MTSFRINNGIFVDFILLNVFLDLILLDEIDVFCRSFKFFFLIFCSFSFILYLVPIVSFRSYLILMSKTMHLIHKFIATQNSSASLYSILSYQNKFIHPTSTIKFSRIFQPHRLLCLEKFSNPPPVYSNSTFIRHSKVVAYLSTLFYCIIPNT